MDATAAEVQGDGSSDLLPDRGAERWLRRALTIPGFVTLALLSWALLLPALALGLLVDALRGRGLVATRTALFFAWYFSVDLLGLALAFALWLGWRLHPGVSWSRFLDWNWWLELFWADLLLRGGSRIFALRYRVEGLEEAREAAGNPALVFIRHASTADVLLPVVYLSRPLGMRLRYVLKRELLWEPCLDVAGQRLPNIFVRRGSGNPQREIAVVRRLARALGPGDAVLIYPEGTRFTVEKQRRALERLAASGNETLAEKGRALRHVLPPRPGGPLALLEACPDADVVFMVHTGFEGVRTVRDFAAGKLIGRTIKIRFWRVAAADIPSEPAARAEWLFDEWQKVDRWVDREAE